MNLVPIAYRAYKPIFCIFQTYLHLQSSGIVVCLPNLDATKNHKMWQTLADFTPEILVRVPG